MPLYPPCCSVGSAPSILYIVCVFLLLVAFSSLMLRVGFAVFSLCLKCRDYLIKFLVLPTLDYISTILLTMSSLYLFA